MCIIHKWKYTSNKRKRSCIKCGLEQEAIYDMGYGGTYYVNIE